MISGPGPTAKTRLLSFNSLQFRVVTGLLTGINTLRGHLNFTGLWFSPLCGSCGAEEGTSSFDFTKTCILGSIFLDPEYVEGLRLGSIWNYSKGMGLPGFDMRLWGTKGPSKGLHASGPKVLEPNYYTHTQTITGLLQSKLTDLANLNCYGNGVVI